MKSVAALFVLLALVLVAMIPALEADPRPNFFFPPVPIPIISECLKAIDKVEDCQEEVLTALLQGKLRFSSNCCAAIESLPDACFGRLFLGPFTKVIGDQVKGFCRRFVAPIGSP